MPTIAETRHDRHDAGTSPTDRPVERLVILDDAVVDYARVSGEPPERGLDHWVFAIGGR